MVRKSLSNKIKRTIRKLRKSQTETEEKIWQLVRNRKLLGKKFLRQHPIVFEWNKRERFFVADFYCSETNLIVEIDGPIHARQKDYDKAREFVLKSLGKKIIRFTNRQVKKNIEAVLARLKEAITHPLNPSLTKRGEIDSYSIKRNKVGVS